MRILLLAIVFSAAVVAPALYAFPTVEACQPYTYYCVIDGQLHYGCGTQVPNSCIMSVTDLLPRA